MPDTPNHGLPFETPSDQPGITLHGGLSGTEPILAEAVDDALTVVEADIGAVSDRVTTLENAPGWYIIHNQVINGAIVFNIPTNTYELIQVRMRGGLDDIDQICLRVNSDDTALLHSFVWEARRFDNTIQGLNIGNGTLWALARWSTAFNNLAHATIYETVGNNFLSFEGGGYRAARDNAVRSYTVSGGHLSEVRTLSSLLVASAAGTTFRPTHVWIWGFRP